MRLLYHFFGTQCIVIVIIVEWSLLDGRAVSTISIIITLVFSVSDLVVVVVFGVEFYGL